MMSAVVICIFLLVKSFSVLRVFENLSQMVTMLGQVTKDISTFMLFFLLIIWQCSLIFNAIGLTNVAKNARQKILDDQVASGAGKGNKVEKDYPGVEYQYLPVWMAQFVAVLRLGLGDFDFAESSKLDEFENLIYWAMWAFIIWLTCIIFLNFVIAEVSESYNKVKEDTEGLFLKQKC